MSDDLDTTIRENAEGPSETRSDSVSVRQHPLGDQIEADRYLQSKQATRKKGLGIALKKLVPPGTD